MDLDQSYAVIHLLFQTAALQLRTMNTTTQLLIHAVVLGRILS